MARKRIDMRRIRAATETIGRELQGDSRAGTGDLVFIALDKIELNPNNPRRLSIRPEDVRRFAALLPGSVDDGDSYFDAAYAHLDQQSLLTDGQAQELRALVGLAHSIHAQDLIQPIVITTAPDGRYMVVAGERRYLAHLFLRRDTIRAILRPLDAESFDERLITLAENINREGLSLDETVAGIEALIEVWSASHPGEKITGTTLSRIIHRSPQHCRKLLQIIRAPADVRDRIRGKELTKLNEVLEVVRAKEDADKSKKVESRTDTQKRPPRVGRSRTRVNLGVVTNPKVPRLLIERVLGEDSFRSLFAHIDWDNLDAAQDAWNDFLEILDDLI